MRTPEGRRGVVCSDIGDIIWRLAAVVLSTESVTPWVVAAPKARIPPGLPMRATSFYLSYSQFLQ